jgi:hypothetical protein
MAAYLELEMKLNADFREPLRFESAPGVPEDVTGVDFVFEIRPEPGSTTRVIRATNAATRDETGLYVGDATNGIVVLTLRNADLDHAAIAAALGPERIARMSFDLLRSRDGLTRSPIEGQFVFRQGTSIA